MLAGVRREYPHKLDHVMAGAGEVRGPRALHPAFYGCFDWHSAVHGHWLLARVLRLAPGVPEREEIVGVLDEHLSARAMAGEMAYLGRPLARSFERTYGWAWALKLHEELVVLAEWAESARTAGVVGVVGPMGLGVRSAAWRDAVEPLAREMAGRFMEYLPRLTYPIRTGVHPNTAFGMSFALDWAQRVGDRALGALVRARAGAYFGGDAGYPAHLEPSGSDFFSPALVEADLMRRVLGGEFAGWFARFLPGAAEGEPARLFAPAEVSDRSDPQIVHLDGLNLGRAWCMRSIAGGLGAGGSGGSGVAARLVGSAAAHEEASLPHVASGEYVGEHWLATFAVLALTGA